MIYDTKYFLVRLWFLESILCGLCEYSVYRVLQAHWYTVPTIKDNVDVWGEENCHLDNHHPINAIAYGYI